MTVERLHIGVVDDDAPVRKALSRLLRSAGFDVMAYGSAEEFLRRTQEHGVACLVLDLHLPLLAASNYNARSNAWRSTYPSCSSPPITRWDTASTSSGPAASVS